MYNLCKTQLQDSNHIKLLELAERSLEDNNTFVVDLEVKGKGDNPIVSLYLESEKGGISLDECAKVSRRLQVMIEAHEVLGEKFILNVSSPGLDRPLKVIRQYKANQGRNAKVRYLDNGATKVLEGKIVTADDTGMEIEVNGQSQKLDFSTIIETKILPVF